MIKKESEGNFPAAKRIQGDPTIILSDAGSRCEDQNQFQLEIVF